LDHILLDIDEAIPCGLIVNELVSNSLKHAFPNGQSGETQIRMQAGQNREITLVVGDNGIGFPSTLDFRETESLGLQLVNTLVDQLEGSIEINGQHGTEFRITWPAT
jgi:two-component sensor histidine kinase